MASSSLGVSQTAEPAVDSTIRPKTLCASHVGSCDLRPLTTVLAYVSSTSRSLSVVVYSGFSGLPTREFNSSSLAFVHEKGLWLSVMGLPLALTVKLTRNGTQYLPCPTPHGKNLARNHVLGAQPGPLPSWWQLCIPIMNK